MALIIPKSVGGTVEDTEVTVQTPAKVEQPALVIPPQVSGQQLAPEPAADELGMFDIFTGESRETRATRELPELGKGGLLSGESKATVAAITPVLLTTTNPAEIGRILESNFENIRIQEDEKGNLIAGNNATGARVVINKPGVSQLDIVQGLGITAAFFPSAKLAGAIPKGAELTAATIAKQGAKGAATAGATESVLQAGQEAAGGEFNAEDVAIASALGVAAETALPIIQRVREGFRASKVGAARDEIKQVGESVSEAVEAQKGLAEAVGEEVPLFQAQQTTLPAVLEKQSFIAQLPAGTQKASNSLKTQNESVSKAVTSFLDMIAPPEAIVTGAEKIRTAAQAAIQTAKRIRSEKVSPIYNNAFSEGAEVALKPVKDLIKGKIDSFPDIGEVAKSLRKASKLLTGKQGGKPTLKQLHGAKLEIDQMLNSFGKDSLGNTTKAEIKEVQQLLLTQMDDASDLYRLAREQFSAESPVINKLQDSIIGKIADIDDTQLKNISKTIFDPAETNLAVIRQAKKVINDIDPDAWNQILRTELERRMGSIRADITSVTGENIPGQLHRAIFGNSKQRQVLFNAVDGETAKNLKYLETVLSRAKLGRPGGSQTAIREEIKQELRGGVVQSIRNFFSSPIKTIVSTGDDAAFNKRVKNMAEVLFDPNWKAQMEKIRKLNPNSPAAARAMAQLLNGSGKE